MKSFYVLALLVLIAGCQPQSVSGQTYTQQEGIVMINVSTQGNYQFILQPVADNPPKRFIVTNLSDSLIHYFAAYHGILKQLPIVFDGITTADKLPVYTADPSEIQVLASELPTIRVTTLTLNLETTEIK